MLYPKCRMKYSCQEFLYRVLLGSLVKIFFSEMPVKIVNSIITHLFGVNFVFPHLSVALTMFNPDIICIVSVAFLVIAKMFHNAIFWTINNSVDLQLCELNHNIQESRYIADTSTGYPYYKAN